MRIVFLFLIFIYEAGLYGQSAYQSFDRNHQSLSLHTTFSKLKNTKDQDYFVLPGSIGFSGGYHYLFSLKNFYGIGLGAEVGYLNYKIIPAGMNLFNPSNRIMNIRIPVYINKFYPFNNKTALNVKSGICLSSLLSSLKNFNAMAINDKPLYETYANINGFPHFGFLFGLGGAFHIKEQNFITLNLQINHYFMKKIKINYEYYPIDSDNSIPGNLYATGSFISISLNYHFTNKLLDEN